MAVDLDAEVVAVALPVHADVGDVVQGLGPHFIAGHHVDEGHLGRCLSLLGEVDSDNVATRRPAELLDTREFHGCRVQEAHSRRLVDHDLVGSHSREVFVVVRPCELRPDVGLRGVVDLELPGESARGDVPDVASLLLCGCERLASRAKLPLVAHCHQIRLTRGKVQEFAQIVRVSVDEAPLALGATAPQLDPFPVVRREVRTQLRENVARTRTGPILARKLLHSLLAGIE
mmetsp:Transcript_18126/g.39382  ORF Transcript_18126/g.39382 Transcript_18126/m.39382 type:complete len:231 (+) Transcript_18126:877-1569(+)